MLAIFTLSKFLFPNLNIVYHTFIAGLTLGIIICFLYPFLFISKVNALSVSFYLACSFAAFIIIFLKTSTINLVKIKKFQVFLWISLTTNVLFVYYYDAFKNISPSHVDTLSNYYWIKYNLTSPDLGYFPGLTIISNISYMVVDPLYNLNYFSVSLSLIILLSINLILYNTLSNTSLFIFNLFLISPIYYPLLYTRVGLNNGMLFALFFYAIITIFIKYRYFLRLNIANIIIVITTLFAAGLTAPHMLLLIFPSILYSCWVVRHQVSIKMLSIFLSIYGVALALGISYNLKFPSYWKYLLPSYSYSSSYSSSSSSFSSESSLNLMSELIKVKFPIRPVFESYLSSFAYIFLIITVISLIYAFKYKSIKYQIILGYCFFLNITNLTGLFEFSYLKGRSGWYLMYAFALFASFILDTLLKKFESFKLIKYLNTLLFIGVLSSSILSTLVPPKPYRIQNEDGLLYMKNTLKKKNASFVHLKTDLQYAELIDKRILVNKFPNTEIWQYDYILLNMQSDIPDLFLANIRRYEDRDFKKFIEEQKNDVSSRIKLNQNIVGIATKFGKFTTIESNLSFILLKRTNL